MKRFFGTLLLVSFLLYVTVVSAVPTTLNLNMQWFNETGLAINTSYTGTVRIYETGSGSPSYSSVLSWKTDNEGIASLQLTNVDLDQDVQYELTLQATGETETDRLNITSVTSSFFARNTSFASSWNFLDGTNIPSGLADGDDDTQLTQEQVEDFSGGMATNGNGVDFTYDDGAGTLTPSFDCSDVAGGNITCDSETLIVVLSGYQFDDLEGIPSGLSDGDDDTIYDDGALTANFTTVFARALGNWTYLLGLEARHESNASFIDDVNSSLSARIDAAGSSFNDDGLNTNDTSLFTTTGLNWTYLLNFRLLFEGNTTIFQSIKNDTNETTRVNNIASFSCGAGDFIDSFDGSATPSCSTPISGGGGGGSATKLQYANEFLHINESDNLATGFNLSEKSIGQGLNVSDLNVTNTICMSDEDGNSRCHAVGYNATVPFDGSVDDADADPTNELYDDAPLTANFTTVFERALGNWTYLFNLNTTAGIEALGFVTGAHTPAFEDDGLNANDTAFIAQLLGNWTYLLNLNTTAGIEALGFTTGAHTVDTNTNAETECAGTTTYYDGEGNCDDISSVYESASSNDFDPDRLAGDTTDDDLIDDGLLQAEVPLTDEVNTFTVNQTFEGNISANGVFVGRVNATHWRIGFP